MRFGHADESKPYPLTPIADGHARTRISANSGHLSGLFVRPGVSSLDSAGKASDEGAHAVCSPLSALLPQHDAP